MFTIFTKLSHRICLFLFFYGLFFHKLFAQDTLTLEQAFEITLQNNFGIKIARNNAEIAQNNAYRGNANLLPRIFLNGNASFSSNNTNLKFANNIPEVNRNGATSRNISTSIGAEYTLFNGFNNQYNLDRLQLIAERGEIQSRQTIETTLLSVSNAYWNLAKQTATYQIALESIKISNERLLRAQNRNEYGVNNKLAVLNAEVDANTDSINFITAELALQNAKRDLNQLMGRNPDTPFEVDTKIVYQNALTLEGLKETARKQNSDLRNAEYNELVSQVDLKIAQAGRYPRLNANASYGYSRNATDAGIVLANRNIGFNTSLNLTFDIFDGNKRNISIQNAKINVLSSKEQYNELIQRIEKDVTNAFARYQNNLKILQIQERSLFTAQTNFERTVELFNFGQATTTQFREAQLNLINAKNRLSNAQFDAKIAEVELLRISGLFLKQE